MFLVKRRHCPYLFVLARNIAFSNYVQPVVLRTSSLKAGDIMEVVSWSDDRKHFRDILRKVEFTVLPNSICEKEIHSIVPDQFVCVKEAGNVNMLNNTGLAFVNSELCGFSKGNWMVGNVLLFNNIESQFDAIRKTIGLYN